MDFLDPKKKKQHRIRLFIGYAITAFILMFSTYFIVLFTSGYGYDRNTGSFIRNGLIVVDSSPVNGNVFVNGTLSGRTVRRLVIPEGDYLIEVRQDGYRTWQRQMGLVGSVIEQLNYPFLFPEVLETEPIASYALDTNLITQSPDRRWLVIERTNKVGNFDVIDLGSSDFTADTITLPADTYTPSDSKHRFELVEWSTDNQNILIKHSWADGSEYLVVNVDDPLQSINVSKLFTQFSDFQVVLRDKNASLFYLYNPVTFSLVEANASNGETEVILGGVVDYKPYQKDVVVYANKDGEIRIKKADNDYLVRKISQDSTYLLDYAEFNRKDYLVFSAPSESKAYIYIDPLKKLEGGLQPAASQLLTVDKPGYLSFSGNARFIALQGLNQFAVFDAETNRRHNYTLDLTLGASNKAYWMDGHRLTVDFGKKTHVFDFNGINQHELTSTDTGFKVFFDRDYENMFNVHSNENTRNITTTPLIIEN